MINQEHYDLMKETSSLSSSRATVKIVDRLQADGKLDKLKQALENSNWDLVYCLCDPEISQGCAWWKRIVMENLSLALNVD